MIKRFITKESKSPFALKLLVNALYSAMEKAKASEDTKAANDGKTGGEDTGEQGGMEGAGERGNGNGMTETTGMREMEDALEELNSPDLFVECKKTLEKVERLSGSIGKTKIFNSDSYGGTSESDGSFEKPILRGKEKNGEAKLATNDKKTGGEKLEKSEAAAAANEEEQELLKLLRTAQANISDHPQASKPVNAAKANEESEVKKCKEDGKSLMDFLNDEAEMSGAVEESKFEEKTEDSDSLEAKMNEEIKKTLLLSSTDEDCEMKEPSPEKERKPKLQTVEPRERKSDVRKTEDSFYIPRISPSPRQPIKKSVDVVKLAEDSVSDVEVDEPAQNESTDEVCQDVDHTSSSSFDSDIQQIAIVKSQDSPSKGRRNIKEIIKADSLEIGTRQARRNEADRKKRLSERNRLFTEFNKLEENKTRLVLDFDRRTNRAVVIVDKSLAKKLKPHQVEGVRFMWNNCFESVKRLKEDSGSGCILAHCMGLGKTLQVVTLVHTLLTHKVGVKSVLILCPFSTIRNWIMEFRVWLKHCATPIRPFDITYCKTLGDKLAKIKKWSEQGGVLIISYDVFRSFVSRKHLMLVNPGSDLIVCDEGHLIKNEKSSLSRCIAQVKTRRRIVLTGTPLQNNLIEYYCMVQFVKPNILGTKREFMNGFVNPIKNGQFEDSTQFDVRIMKRRAHVLHSLLEGFIQRYDYSVLKPFLPEKQEFVISVTLTQAQDELYRQYLGKSNLGKEAGGLFNDYSWLQKIWTHPQVFLESVERQKNDPIRQPLPDDANVNWGSMVPEWMRRDESQSGKLILLFRILKACRKCGDKILVFSQYLTSLNLIETFLRKSHDDYKQKRNTEFADSWVSGHDYFRMDGSTSGGNRFEFCRKFNNKKETRSRLFLVSTRAGGLGINLVAANRVVIFDVSWNPSHDLQSIFRVYRFGQTKPCYVYRFLAEGTMEEKIYKRQVTKLSLAHRILDEHQIERHYTMTNLQELYTYTPTPRSEWQVPKVPRDNLMAEILASSRDIIVRYHEHDSLLENIEEEVLSEEERRAAWEDFERERVPVPIAMTNRHQTNTGVQASPAEMINEHRFDVVQTYSLPAHQAYPPPPQQGYQTAQQVYPSPQQSYPTAQQSYQSPQQSYQTPQQTYPAAQQGYPSLHQAYAPTESLILSESKSQMLKIVDVRTLNESVGPVINSVENGVVSVPEGLSDLRTMQQQPHEDYERYRERRIQYFS